MREAHHPTQAALHRGAAGRRLGCKRAVGAGSWRPTPHLATHAPRPHAPSKLPLENSSLPPFRVSCKMPNFGGSADQALSGRHPRACAGSAILQETLLGGRLGGGWDVASWRRRSCALRSSTPRPRPPHCTSPPPSFLRPIFVIPALPTVIPARRLRHSCAGRNGGGSDWGVGGRLALARAFPPPT